MNQEVLQGDELSIRAAFLTASDLKLAASLLYQSYHDDPVFLEIFGGDSSDYEQRLRASIREELSAFWQAQQPIIGLYLGEALVGVACLNSPHEGLGSERFWHWRLKMLLGAGYLTTKQMIEKEEKIFTSVPLESFHMLSFIAVHPLHQQQGFGHYLVAAVNSVLKDNPQSMGVAVYITCDKYKKLFNDSDYKQIKEISVGKVSGTLMLHYRPEELA
jgi:hypothetical protein